MNRTTTILALVLVAAPTAGALVGGSGPWIGASDYEPWIETAKLTESNPEISDQLGVDLEIDGDTAVVGHHWEDDEDATVGIDVGAVSVFEQTETGWRLDTTFIGEEPKSMFGSAITLDGDTFVTNAPGIPDASPTDEFCPFGTGEVYVYERVEGTWQQTATLSPPGHEEKESCLGGDERSQALSLEGDTLAVGTTDDRPEAYIYERDGEGTWTLTATFEREDVEFSYGYDNSFGNSLDVSANEQRVVIGHLLAPGNESAHVYERSPSGWQHMATLSSPAHQGYTVTIGGDGKTVAGIQGPYGWGPIQLWGETEEGWAKVGQLSARDETRENSRPSDVVLSDSGDRLVLGTWLDYTTPGIGPTYPEVTGSAFPLEGCGFGPTDRYFAGCDGAAFVFDRTEEGWKQTSKIVQLDDYGEDLFGWSIDLDDQAILVGAPYHEGTAHVFEQAVPGSALE